MSTPRLLRSFALMVVPLVVLGMAPVAGAVGPDLVKPPGARGQSFGAPDFDVRQLHARQATPAAGQRSAASALRADVRWEGVNGLPETVLRYGATLTEPQPGGFDARAVARRFIRDNAALWRLEARGLAGLQVRAVIPSPNGAATHVWFQQTLAGLDVFGGSLGVTVDREGRVVWAGGPLWPEATDPGPGLLTGAAATRAAAVAVGRPAAVGVGRPSRVLFALPGGETRPAWLTVLDAGPVEVYDTVVDAVTGTTLFRLNRFRHAHPQGNVFRTQNPEVPGAAQQLTSFAGASFNDNGWVDDRTTAGNNAIAVHDPSGEAADQYSPQTPASGDAAFQHFNYTFTNAIATSTGSNYTTDRDSVVTQAFYYTNLAHDRWYPYGFDEASGNFQHDNFGRGGTGNDRVIVLVDHKADEGECCNASFGTPADGSSPTMRLYIETPGGGVFGHGALDGDTVIHEFGHGVHNRLVNGGGGMGTGVQTGALGEGWGDAMAFSFWNDPILFEYVTSDKTTGLRRVAYDNSGHTYATLCNPSCQVHADGEIWATALWDVRAHLVQRRGQSTGVTRFEQIMIDGMKNTGESATFLAARDGILITENTIYADVDYCGVWNAFAGRGMGLSATSATQMTPVEGFDVPAECVPAAAAGGPYSVAEGSTIALDATTSSAGTHPSTGALSFAWDLDGDGEYDDAVGPTPTIGPFPDDAVMEIGLQVTNQAGVSATGTATVTVTNVAPTVGVVVFDTGIDEGASASISVDFTDPGWGDTYSATVDWGYGDPAESAPAAITVPGGPGSPDRGRVQASHVYGDDGVFTVTVTVSDDDGGTAVTSADISVLNVDPTAAIDPTGSVTAGPHPTFVTHIGEPLTLTGSSADPGSDDLTATWTWGDGATSETVHLVNPPDPDPPGSPTVQPRDITDSATHTYAEACLYTVPFEVTDDEGGFGSHSATVIAQGDATVVRNAGWWQQQYRGRGGANLLPTSTRQCYLAIAGHLSSVFHEEVDMSTFAAATDLLHNASNTGFDELDRQLLTTWLNFANGALDLDALVDSTGNGLPDVELGDLLAEVEAARLAPGAGPEALRSYAESLERINGG